MFVFRKVTAWLLLTLIFATACTTTKVPPPKLSGVGAGDPKYQLYAVLGGPDDQVAYAGGQLEYFTYVYTQGSCKSEVKGNFDPGPAMGDVFSDPFAIILLPIILPIALLGAAAGKAATDSVSSHLNCDTVDAALIVDEADDGTIQDVVLVVEERPGAASKMVKRLQEWTGASEEDRASVWETAKQAAFGDAEAQYTFAGYLSQPNARMAWLERAAMQRHPSAVRELLLTANEIAVPLCADRTDAISALDWMLTTEVWLRREEVVDDAATPLPRWLALNNSFWLDRCRAEMTLDQIGMARAAAASRLARLGVDDADGQLQDVLLATRRARGSTPPGEVFKDCDVCPEMTIVPPGRYRKKPQPTLGLVRTNKEEPLVAINRPLAVGAYEVTFAEWDACVADGGCDGYVPDDGGWGRGDRPVINVSWEDVQGYIAWLNEKTVKNYRLPTSDEWAYVARSGTTTPFYFGHSITTGNANYLDVGIGRTVPVGDYSQNWFGLCETTGNVREWLDDCRDPGASISRLGGGARIPIHCVDQPQAGGSWADDQDWLSFAISPRKIRRNTRSDRSGFRVVRSPL